MTRKLNLNFMLVIAVAVFLSVFFTAAVSYRLLQEEVFADLSAAADMIEKLNLAQQMQNEKFAVQESGLRITWIAADGAVLYDSYAGNTLLESHEDRPEVVQALEDGEGKSVRKSRTMERNIFFYARRVQDGSVIRIAKEAGSIWHIYRNMLPVILLIAVFSFLASMWLAGFLTKVFVRQEEALKNARIRQEFSANVSHELKTPLTSISGYAELIANGMASGKEARHFAEEIHRNAQRLLALINDILRLSELDDMPEHQFTFETVDLYELAARCMAVMEPIAARHEVLLSLTGTPLMICADKDLIEELLYNLCDNAIRYNQKGGHVWITVTDRLMVRDDGIGIPPKYQKRVFERFFRADKSRSRKTGGTGLGLAIVKHIAEVHHAGISLDSAEGVGTTVSVQFPEISSFLPAGSRAGRRMDI
ncbi:MAG: two-component sensor histidine kinase [Lachnospiraceae bacterium]|nr:two-component sensor histidine kinase [Lachnospiraceae bacterium]